MADRAHSRSFDELALHLRACAVDRAGSLADADGPGSVERYVRELVDREAPALSAATKARLTEQVLTQTVGLGPLEPLLADPDIDEIMVNGHDRVFVERAGTLTAVPSAFEGPREFEHLIERIVAPLGRRVDESSPICDARLPDGSRVNVVIPPLSLSGPLLTIRRFRHSGLSAEHLVANGTLDEPSLRFLAACVRERASLLVSGGTGSGKTTTLNALSEFIPESERIVTIEDAAELRLRQSHLVRLEARPPNLEGRGEITIRDLVRTALRMRPDRIVVGEVRGGEALDMLSALNTGHDGGMTTVHASSPEGALARVETLALMAGVEIPFVAVRRLVASAFDLVVHQERVGGGARRVVAIAELTAGGDTGYELRELGATADDGAGGLRCPLSPRLARIHAAVFAAGTGEGRA